MQDCQRLLLGSTGTGGDISDALHDLKEMQDYLKTATPGATPAFDLPSWIKSDTWWQLLLKILAPITVVLILFCLYTLCALPCIRSMITNATTNALVQYELLHAPTLLSLKMRIKYNPSVNGVL